MPKRFFIAVAFFCMFFSVVGNSWAVCDFMESGRPRVRDLYQTDPSNDKNKQALICEKGRCEDGVIVFAKSEHYRARDKQSGNVLYKCNRSGNNSWDVLSEGVSYLETISNVCGNSNTGGAQIFPVNNPNGVVLGSIRGNGVFVTDICIKPYDKRCGVMCSPDNKGKMVNCDDGFFSCDDGGKWQSGYPKTNKVCPASDPTKFDVDLDKCVFPHLGDTVGCLRDSASANAPYVTVDDLCWACKGKYPYLVVGEWTCTNNEQYAWCEWRRNKESKNTEWKDGHCECTDKGKEWNTETHDCVETKGSGKNSGGKTGGGSGKTGSGTGKTSGGKTGGGSSKTGSGSGKTGGSGSGKTGGGSSGNGKLGSGKADEKCGVKCDKGKEYQFFYCNKDIIHCVPDLSGGYEFDENSSFFFNVCEYSDPVNFVAEHAQRYEMVEVSFYSGDGYNGNMDLMGPAGLKNGDKVSLSDPFCRVCKPGTYKDFYGKNCYKNENEAWCKWRKNKDKLNTDWQNGECKCLDYGMKWDNKVHNCVADNMVGNNTGQGDKKITTANCKININATVKCRDSGTFSGEVELELSAENCQEYQANSDKNLSEIAKLLCVNLGGVDNILTDADVQDAKRRVDKFLQYSESNTSVWKNADGKFNTARLASDATAGVILGTVGGIVSAHIIKKKQVEKGFDALNCAIGGQKVADWGDEFRVGLGMR